MDHTSRWEASPWSENTSEWDSLAYLSVISVMEEEFEIEITEKNINNFGSVKNILNEVNHL